MVSSLVCSSRVLAVPTDEWLHVCPDCPMGVAGRGYNFKEGINGPAMLRWILGCRGLVRGGDGGQAGKPYSSQPLCNRVFVSDCPTARCTPKGSALLSPFLTHLVFLLPQHQGQSAPRPRSRSPLCTNPYHLGARAMLSTISLTLSHQPPAAPSPPSASPLGSPAARHLQRRVLTHLTPPLIAWLAPRSHAYATCSPICRPQTR